MDPVRRVFVALAVLALVVVAGTVGYAGFGFGWLDAFYQTVTTITTVGFREVKPIGNGGKVFTICLILAGVGTALYTLTIVLEALIEGHLRDRRRRRHMERQIARLSGHVIICGWGRVGRAIGGFLAGAGRDVLVIDREAERLARVPHPTIEGDVAEDETLARAGIDRAGALVAALDTDADNVYVTLSARTLRPDLTIVARARTDSSEAKLTRAGANHVVNPQRIGGFRMAAFALQPHVVDFLEIVMHDGGLEYRLAECMVPAGSPVAGRALGDSGLRGTTGALVLALRDPAGHFLTNPDRSTILQPGHVLIAIGTSEQLAALTRFVGQPAPNPSG